MLFDSSLIPKRWHKKYQGKVLTNCENSSIISTKLEHKGIQTLSKKEKFNKLRIVLNSISDICCELGMRDFNAKFEQLSQMQKLFGKVRRSALLYQ